MISACICSTPTLPAKLQTPQSDYFNLLSDLMFTTIPIVPCASLFGQPE